MRLALVGREGAVQPVRPGDHSTVTDNQAATWHTADLQQWWLNGPLGLEHGFTLERPPGPDLSHADILIVIEVEGASPVLQGDGVRLDAGAFAYRYTDLFAEDATGARVAARMEVAPGQIVLRVADRGAHYPLRIDPLLWVEQSKLVADNGVADDNFGDAVALDGDSALVGAGTGNNGYLSGSVYTFERDSMGLWSQTQQLVPGDNEGGDYFGYRIAVDDGTALIGAFYKTFNKGAVYVYERDSGGVWSEEQTLTDLQSNANDRFGCAVAVSGDYAIVGVCDDDPAGSAVVFERDSGGVWSQKQKLTGSTTGPTFDEFGYAVAIDGDYAIVGAPRFGASDIGQAYVFERTGSTWSETAKLVADDSVGGDAFGGAVALVGDRALIAANRHAGQAGAVYEFERLPGGWIESQKLSASDASPSSRFGTALAMRADDAIVCAQVNVDTGVAYAFERDAAGDWTEKQKFASPDASASSGFCRAAAIGDATALIGAPGDDGNASGSGAAYVFRHLPAAGSHCDDQTICASGFCVDGVCCESACGDGDPADCQACSLAAGSSADGTCDLLSQRTLCRDAANECDAAEQCDGAAPTCPDDVGVADGTPCDSEQGLCAEGVCEPLGGGGQGGGTSASGATSGGPDASPTSGQEGCSCRVVGKASPSTGPPWSLMLLALVVARRRRTHRLLPAPAAGSARVP